MSPQPHDFRQPTPLPAAARADLARWHPAAALALDKQSAEQLPFALQTAAGGLDLRRAADALAGRGEADLVYEVPRADPGAASWLVLPRPAMLAIVGGLIGEPVAEGELARALTPVEDSLADYAAAALFLEPLSRTWPLGGPLALAAPARHPADGPGPAGGDYLVVSFRTAGPFGEAPWRWAVPRDWLAGGEAASAAPTRGEREAAVRELPLRLSVSLGSARVSLLRLARLARGDVLLLEQPVSEPLTASLSGQAKFLVWPGAVGARQAVAIHSPVGP